MGHNVYAVSCGCRNRSERGLIKPKKQLRAYICASKLLEGSLANKHNDAQCGFLDTGTRPMPTQRVTNERVIVNVTTIEGSQAIKLLAKSLTIATFRGARLTLKLMKLHTLTSGVRRLNNIGTRKRVSNGIKGLLIDASWLWHAHVASHRASATR